ncbi:hypothetical protein [Oceanisphaera psychrotolerans]|uniref:Uncharacterized protein n=1 Tax=Oceanisphaera psychrotolerans TaxID=1414654 RepID=A0A1J4QG44_9GAMM|nr:hypothetical protein [Oceanisphaera psychrotolerans]OIN12423.1 hypothetical protein BFR47_01735 [Oceanisphaera psychrotolerans]
MMAGRLASACMFGPVLPAGLVMATSGIGTLAMAAVISTAVIIAVAAIISATATISVAIAIAIAIIFPGFRIDSTARIKAGNRIQQGGCKQQTRRQCYSTQPQIVFCYLHCLTSSLSAQ